LDKRTKLLVNVLIVLAVAAAGYYGYRFMVAEKAAPAKMVVKVGGPIPKAAAPAQAPAAKEAPAKEQPRAAEAAKPKPAPAMPMVPGQQRPEILYASLGKRDPFMSPLEVPKVYPAVPANARPLEKVPSEQIIVKAIMWNEKGYRALVSTPDGRGYTVKAGDSFGNKKGRVAKITENRVYVTEHIKDVLGNVETVNIVLPLHKEAE